MPFIVPGAPAFCKSAEKFVKPLISDFGVGIRVKVSHLGADTDSLMRSQR